MLNCKCCINALTRRRRATTTLYVEAVEKALARVSEVQLLAVALAGNTILPAATHGQAH
jgi:hypothetical protein